MCQVEKYLCHLETIYTHLMVHFKVQRKKNVSEYQIKFVFKSREI